MIGYLRVSTLLTVLGLIGGSALADDGKTAAAPAVYAKAASPQVGRLAAWPGYVSYYSGAYYGVYRWR